MATENTNAGTITIGESAVMPSGSFELNRITVPNGPWVWQLVIADKYTSQLGDIVLTTSELRRLRDLIDTAIAMEQRSSAL
jgi:hypothetical protein